MMNDLKTIVEPENESRSLSLHHVEEKKSNWSYDELMELVHCLYQENKKLRCMNQHLDAQIDIHSWMRRR